MDSSKAIYAGYILLGVGLALMFTFAIVGTFKVKFPEDGAVSVADKLRDPGPVTILATGLAVLLIGILVYFMNNKGNEREMFTVLYIMVFASFLFSNLALVNSLFQVTPTK